jgi:hypothetical protein
MSCNSCSNVTLPGVVGPAGAVGSNGSNGTDGDHIVVLKVYKRASSTPAQPGASSYDFSTLTLTPPAGWSTSVPAGTDPCYVSHGTASVTPPATVDSSITWTNPPEIAFENGTDGVAVIDIDTSSITHTSNTPTAVKTTNISDNTIGTAGDFIKVKGNILISKVDGYVAKVEVKFDGNTMFLQYLGSFGGSMSMLGLRFEVDLIVTATNTIRPHIRFEAMDQTDLPDKYMIGNISQAFDGVIDFYQSSVTLNSGGPRAITVELTSDNVNTVALTYYEVTKYLKA